MGRSRLLRLATIAFLALFASLAYASETETYTYDALGRLITARGGPSTGASLWTQNYSYDGYGNRTSVTASGSSASLRKPGRSPEALAANATAQSSMSLPSTDSSRPQLALPSEQLVASNQIESDSPSGGVSGATSNSHHASRSTPASPPPPSPADGHASLSYDAATNRITTSGFAYDAAGNQVRALIAGGASQRFQYDAANRLTSVMTDANVTIASYHYGLASVIFQTLRRQPSLSF